ncbi:alpha/beta fold hydrolase [Nodosilinea sp. LEGE 06152]|uniref:alpha/beta fold hydrolase n=1 Tax=Nodosilinea sp. LEGE 06152 TaxID=2777966 RepID=UPI0018810398|nr:alpha/beta fold hydrolase [Nodosilinea sp. LEGE 06152]MBE9157031.1 alpha/beta fold hydrolase [Nodosilinea sp. LEGE 06152]
MKHLTRTLSLPLLTLAAALVAQIPALAQTPRYPTVIPCPTVLPPNEIEGKTITCGVFTVPENYAEPNGRQIDLTYAVLHSHSLSPAPDPVMDLRGGPGGSTLESNSLGTRAKIYEPLRQTRDIVVLDQRGTQFSNRLGCAPVGLVTYKLLLNPDSEYAGLLDPLIEQMRSRFPDAPDNQVQAYAFFDLCARILENQGNDLSNYNTPNSAQDVVNLTAALGYDKINLYGISYGTYLAQRIMANHPDRVRSVVLDSTVPMQANKYEAIVRDLEVSFLNLVEDCEAEAACGAAYPNLRDRTVALLNQLDQAPLPLAEPITPLERTTPIEQVTAADFATLIELMNHHPGQIAPYLPLTVQELEQGITTTFAGVITGALFSSTANSPTFESSPEAYRLQARDFEAKAEDILRARATAAETSRPASQWVQQIEAIADTLPEAENTLLMVNLMGVGYQQAPRNRQTLIDFVAEEFEGDNAATLTAAVNAMSEVEVRHIYDVVSALTDSALAIDAEITSGMFRSVDCRELVPFSNPAQTQANYAAMLMPQLGTGRVVAAQQAYEVCSFWPVEAAPASEHAPINSSIPTLVLQGRYDVQTNTEMGIGVMEGLRNGTFVELSSTGHGAIVASQCAKDIGVAFVNDPERTPDTSCTAGLFPNFVMPPAD